jgi:hypothetical protein
VASVSKAEPEPVLRLSPAQGTMKAGDAGLQMLAWEDAPGGGRRDRTGEVTWGAEPAGIVEIEPGGYVRPVGSGRATVTATWHKARAEAALTVDAGAECSWDFAEDIVPLFTRAGCNTGTCHGRAEGQNGFHLSLFGYDPAGDFLALTREGGERRISRMDPDQSLLLLKATGRAGHKGGRRLTMDSPEYATLRAWLIAGAPEQRGSTHGAVKELTVEPSGVVLEEPGSQQVRVVARFADGHQRDVTRLAVFRVLDDSAVSIDPHGRAQLLRRIETDLVVRYQSRVVTARLATVINPDLKFDFAALPRANFIDEELYRRLEALRVPPSPPSSDAQFLRRVSLDLTGEQPTPEQVRSFLAETDPDKRVKRIDALLASRDFVRFWQIKLGDMLRITSSRLGNGASAYQTWVGAQLAANTPWDAMVRTLLTALGEPGTRDGGPVNYVMNDPDPKLQAEQTAQRFLGIRLRCAQCHNHPFDVWTQDDYFGLAACFAKVGPTGGGGPMMGRQKVKINPKGQVEHLRTHQPSNPRRLDGEPITVADNDDPRVPLAAWLTAPDNPFFARAAANWVWAQLFGRGLVDPPDDLSRSNPPVHPELLDALARHLVAHKFDLRDLIRTIATSSVYGLSSGTAPGNERDTRLFSHHTPRLLTAHQMADALAQATDVINRYPDRAAGTRAIEVTDPATASTILDTFGRCSRTADVCASTSTPPMSLRQALLVIGGDVIEAKITRLDGYLANLLELRPEPDEIVENLYLRTVCRLPTDEELHHWSSTLKRAPSLREAAEDLFWSLLNSREFAFNH